LMVVEHRVTRQRAAAGDEIGQSAEGRCRH
jgi:hypothetical protein